MRALHPASENAIDACWKLIFQLIRGDERINSTKTPGCGCACTATSDRSSCRMCSRPERVDRGRQCLMSTTCITASRPLSEYAIVVDERDNLAVVKKETP